MLRRTLLALACLLPLSSAAQERRIILASTTSPEQSGLLGYLIPIFRQQTGIDVQVLSVGTGQALVVGARGEADALLVHDRPGETKFMQEEHGTDRREVMYNEFILVGPKGDPASIRQQDPILAARFLADRQATFVSRGDDSGTHRLELRLWRLAGVDRPSGERYREAKQGMAETLALAASVNAYTLTDRASWLAFQDRKDLVLLVERDAALINTYSSILVNPAKGDQIKAADARIWHGWLTSEQGRQAISSYRVAKHQLFFPIIPAPR